MGGDDDSGVLPRTHHAHAVSLAKGYRVGGTSCLLLELLGFHRVDSFDNRKLGNINLLSVIEHSISLFTLLCVRS